MKSVPTKLVSTLAQHLGPDAAKTTEVALYRELANRGLV